MLVDLNDVFDELRTFLERSNGAEILGSRRVLSKNNFTNGDRMAMGQFLYHFFIGMNPVREIRFNQELLFQEEARARNSYALEIDILDWSRSDIIVLIIRIYDFKKNREQRLSEVFAAELFSKKSIYLRRKTTTKKASEKLAEDFSAELKQRWNIQ